MNDNFGLSHLLLRFFIIIFVIVGIGCDNEDPNQEEADAYFEEKFAEFIDSLNNGNITLTGEATVTDLHNCYYDAAKATLRFGARNPETGRVNVELTATSQFIHNADCIPYDGVNNHYAFGYWDPDQEAIYFTNTGGPGSGYNNCSGIGRLRDLSVSGSTSCDEPPYYNNPVHWYSIVFDVFPGG